MTGHKTKCINRKGFFENGFAEFVHTVCFRIYSIYCKVRLKQNNDADFFCWKYHLNQNLRMLYCLHEQQQKKNKKMYSFTYKHYRLHNLINVIHVKKKTNKHVDQALKLDNNICIWNRPCYWKSSVSSSIVEHFVANTLVYGENTLKMSC